MKLCILLASVAMLSFHVKASEVISDEACGFVYKYAEIAMFGRQEGVPLTHAIKSAGDNSLLRNLIISAYKRESYQSESMKEKAINDFANEAMIYCLEQK